MNTVFVTAAQEVNMAVQGNEIKFRSDFWLVNIKHLSTKEEAG
jgi:hypothetical protein